MAPCRTFPLGGIKEAVAKSAPVPAAHERTDKAKAMDLAYSDDPLYMGIFYQVDKPTLGDRLRADVERSQADAGGRPLTIGEILKIFA